MSKQLVNQIAQSIKERFRTFGDGQRSDFNPIVNALTDSPLQFAAGVNVTDVVVHVLGCIRVEDRRRQRAKKAKESGK